MTRLLYACLLALCLVLVVRVDTGRAQTPEPEEYRPTVEAALRELEAGHYEEARELFARAHALYPNARTLRGLGYAEFELRHYVACVRRLKQALNTPERALEGALREDTERLLARAQTFVGTLLVEAEPPAAELVVDGAEVPIVSVELEAGTHQVELYVRRGGLPVKRTVVLAGGDRQVLRVRFPDPALPPPARNHDAEVRRWYKSPWLWSAILVVGAGAAVGGVLASRHHSVETEKAYGGSTHLVLLRAH